MLSPSGDLPAPVFKPIYPMSPALADGFFTTTTTWEDPRHMNISGFGDLWAYTEPCLKEN